MDKEQILEARKNAIEDLQKRILFGMARKYTRKYIKLKNANMELQNANMELQSLALTDKLTGLPNRHAQETDFDTMLQIASRDKKNLLIAIIDIDHFKSVNDTYGHAVGDAALKHLATTCKEALRPTDRLYRHGGEEFLLMSIVGDNEDATSLTERLRKSIEASPCKVAEIIVPLTVSIGVDALNANESIKENLPLIDSIKEADIALYEGKNNGRNCVVFSCRAAKLKKPSRTKSKKTKPKHTAVMHPN